MYGIVEHGRELNIVYGAIIRTAFADPGISRHTIFEERGRIIWHCLLKLLHVVAEPGKIVSGPMQDCEARIAAEFKLGIHVRQNYTLQGCVACCLIVRIPEIFVFGTSVREWSMCSNDSSMEVFRVTVNSQKSGVIANNTKILGPEGRGINNSLGANTMQVYQNRTTIVAIDGCAIDEEETILNDRAFWQPRFLEPSYVDTPIPALLFHTLQLHCV